MTAPLTHLCFVMADALDQTSAELPEPVCKEQTIMLAALSRAFQLAGERMKAEAAELERKLLEPVNG